MPLDDLETQDWYRVLSEWQIMHPRLLASPTLDWSP